MAGSSGRREATIGGGHLALGPFGGIFVGLPEDEPRFRTYRDVARIVPLGLWVGLQTATALGRSTHLCLYGVGAEHHIPSRRTTPGTSSVGATRMLSTAVDPRVRAMGHRLLPAAAKDKHHDSRYDDDGDAGGAREAAVS
ncbi:hypothetical protein [Aeromicrobium erythreum]|jgi:hypothetical protein|nr:hypothetical protein [Aeromicrobium erythreum]